MPQTDAADQIPHLRRGQHLALKFFGITPRLAATFSEHRTEMADRLHQAVRIASVQPIGVGPGQAFEGVRFLQIRIKEIPEGHSGGLRFRIDRDQNSGFIRFPHRHILEGGPVEQPESELPDVRHLTERTGIDRDKNLRKTAADVLHGRLNLSTITPAQ